MINYTDHLTRLIRDIVERVPTLAFIDPRDVLVFARFGRSQADGAFATCHCLTLPPSEPGFYFWRERGTGLLTQRSEWFVTKSPVVSVGDRRMKYLMSFALPRFCDQSLGRSRKERLYPGAQPWMAKLDTVVHELYHIDPGLSGIRRIERKDGTYSANCHGSVFFEQVAALVHTYLATGPNPAVLDFLRLDFRELRTRFGGVVDAAFRTFPSFPQRYIERLADQPPCESDRDDVRIVQLRAPHLPTDYTEADLHVRQFTAAASSRQLRKGQGKAA